MTDNEDIERHIREANAWRVAFGKDMDDIRLTLAELKDNQRESVAMMRAERELSDEDWRKLAQHDAAIRIIFHRYRRRGKRPRP